MEKRVTAPGLMEMKARGEKISVLTAYDYAWGSLPTRPASTSCLSAIRWAWSCSATRIPCQVTMEDMIRHTAAVARGAKRALVVSDMPFLSFQVNEEEAVRNAGRLVREAGAQAVKLEGSDHIAQADQRIVDIGIPVMGHVGLTPQSVHQFGGYKMQGKDAAQRRADPPRSAGPAGSRRVRRSVGSDTSRARQGDHREPGRSRPSASAPARLRRPRARTSRHPRPLRRLTFRRSSSNMPTLAGHARRIQGLQFRHQGTPLPGAQDVTPSPSWGGLGWGRQLPPHRGEGCGWGRKGHR